MSNDLRVLVTGVAGDLGQALVKCLRLMDRPVRVFGCDMDGAGIGAAFVERFAPVPRAADPGYREAIQGLCREWGVAAVIPGSEHEIAALGQARAARDFPADVALVCQDWEWFSAFSDKLHCYRALEGRVDLAPFADAADPAAVQRFVAGGHFPCVAKARRGFGSKGLARVDRPEDLPAVLAKLEDPILQAHFDDAHGEFSCGVFACPDFSTAIAFKRSLGTAGNSWYADNHDQDPEVLDYALAVARAAGLTGSCNVQVRKSSAGVRLLEINARFSSLVAARAASGFRDLEWSLLAALGQAVPRPPAAYTPLRFRRFFHELVDFGPGYAELAEWRPRSQPAHGGKSHA